MAKIGKHYQAYLDDRLSMGYTAHEAAGMNGAIQAAELDRADLAQRQRSASTAELLGNDADKPFASAQERINAFGKRDAEGKKLYETSEAYRLAVQRKVALSSDEVAGYVNPMRNVPTNEDMIKQARIDVYNEKRTDLMSKAAKGGPGSAQARLDLMEFHQDPANQAILAEYEQTYAESRPLEMELRAAQARGERVGTSLQPTEAQIQNCEEHPYNAFAADEAGNIVHDVGVQ